MNQAPPPPQASLREATDFALKNGQAVMSVINKCGIWNYWVVSSGGHEWVNWRCYLQQAAQIMLPDGPPTPAP